MLPKNCEIICTHKLKIKNNFDDHKYNIKGFCFNDFLKNKERLLEGTSFILNSILIEVADMLKLEKIFPFYISSNMPNADRNNNKLENKFRKNNPHL